MPAQTTPDYSAEAALSLAMAVVASSPGPLLLLDGDLNLVAASLSFTSSFDVDAETARGQALFDLGGGEWNDPGLRSLMIGAAAGLDEIDVYEMDLKPLGQATRHLVIHAQRLVYLDQKNLRILMAVSDVTEARADQKLKDDALRQNLVLLQEVRHRVANSLQIIASVLLQNARRTHSEETRGHLNDAHNRVMSVAALERQLSASPAGDVDLGVYFTKLCESIATSMIGDHDRISLTVVGGAGEIDSRTSVSLGLIVTELVINALKHAFPNGRVGKIVVTHEIKGPNWIISVADDGVGLHEDPSQIHLGLGTSIVQALASQLSASVLMQNANPGAHVTITHTQIALVNEPDGQVADPPKKRAAGRP